MGFIVNNYLFSRDNAYLGWVEADNVWDAGGNFRGKLIEITGHAYILRSMFTVSPIPKPPKPFPRPVQLPTPQPNILPIIPPIGYQDGF